MEEFGSTTGNELTVGEKEATVAAKVAKNIRSCIMFATPVSQKSMEKPIC